MATTFPTRPSRNADPGQVAWTVWQMLQYLANNVYDAFVGKFAQGSATVPAAATTVIVTIGLTAASYVVSLTPLADPGGRYWVSGKTSTQFQINLQVAAPGGGLPFDWSVKAA